MKSIKVLLIIAFLAGLISCDKPDDLGFFQKQYPVQPPWSSVNDFEAAVIGAYWQLSGPNYFQFGFMNARLTLDAASDGLYNSPNFAVDQVMSDIYNRKNDVNQSWTDNAFICSYIGIGCTNDAISFMESYPDNNPYPFDRNKARIPRIEGELRFCRAFNWWVVSTLFIPMYEPGGTNDDKIVPWRDKLPTGYEDAVNGTLATTQQIYDIMVSDLKKAVKLIPENYVAARDHPSFQFGRANKYTAMALLARVYLQMNEFDKAKSYCDTIINYCESKGVYSLTKDPIDAFKTADGTIIPGTEALWQYIQYEGNGIGSWKAHTAGIPMNMWSSTSFINAQRAVCCSDYFLETVGWQDPVTKQPTAEALADKRYNQLYHRYLASTDMPSGYPTPGDGIYEPSFTTNRAYVWGNKYYRANQLDRKRTNIPLVRLPEIYLTRAILRFKAGDVTGATSDVNKVRARAGISALATVTANDIHNERWKELNFEGDRLTYLRSLHIDIPNGDRGSGTLAWNSDKWLWPILLREQELNNAYKY